MATERRRGLILGGGGSVGLAWEIGVLHGLALEHLDLRNADDIIGTSAGAFAAVALTDPRGIAWAYERQRAGTVAEVAASFSPTIFQTYTTIVRETAGDAIAAGLRFGAFAQSAPPTIDTATRLAVVQERLDCSAWPSDKIRFAAIDADTGVLHLLDKNSGIDLVHAAAASGAIPGVWPVVEACGRRWIDGAVVSPTNVHFAAWFRQCVVISPAAMSLAGVPTQRELELAAPAIRAVVIMPDAPSVEAIGPNPLDPARRASAAEAGCAQGRAFAKRVKDVWTDEDNPRS